jgi:predicted amidohydrolase
VANWPGVRSFAWQALLVARALENQAYVIGINRVGPDANDLDHDGRSLCIDPYGSVQSQLTPGETGWVRTNWDAAELARFRKKFPVLKDRR